jgi:hypothetical protein
MRTDNGAAKGTDPSLNLLFRRLASPARTQFDCLHAGYLPAFHGKSQQGSDEMPSVVAAGAGIHVDEAERLVAHDFEDVGVAADEQARPQPPDFLPGPAVVVAGIPADVCHSPRQPSSNSTPSPCSPSPFGSINRTLTRRQ